MKMSIPLLIITFYIQDDDDDDDDDDGLLQLLFQYEGRGSNDWVYPSGEEYEPFSRY